MKWKCFYELSNRWSIKDSIVLTTKSIDPAKSFHTIGILTMQGVGYREHKNITSQIIPAFKVGYLLKAEIGGNGTLVHFDLNLTSEQVEKKHPRVTKQIIEFNPKKISIMLSADDMQNLQILII